MKKGFNVSAPKMKNWKIKRKERLGIEECPYAYRWYINTPWFSIRIHHFLRSDDKRFFHDHPWDFTTLILKGQYYDVSKEKGRVLRKTFHIYHVKAEHKHYVEVSKKGCWTLVFTSRVKRKWGFWVYDTFKRPLKYFHKYGHPACSEQ